MTNHRISILIPIYGVEKYIERCAVSLFEQTYEDIEYVFVNDCTKDNSIAILKEVIERYPARKPQVRLIEHEQNKGLGGARNTAVAAATGEFLMHVDSDDFVEKSIVEIAVKKQEENNADIVTIGFYKDMSNTSITNVTKAYTTAKDHCLSVINRSAHMGIWAQLIRTSLYKQNGIKVKEGVNMGEDYQVTPLLFYYAKQTDCVELPLYHYDCSNEGSYTNMYSEGKLKQTWESFDIVKNFFKDKSSEYNNAVVLAELKIIAAHLIISEKTHIGDRYFSEAKYRLGRIDYKNYKYLPLKSRILIFLSRNRNLMNMFIKAAKFLVRK